MHILRAYADTSIFGGAIDEEFAEPTKRFFDRVRQGRFRVLVSQITADELTDAPSAVRAIAEQLPRSCIEMIVADKEAADLAAAYIEAGALGAAHRADAMHVAAATAARADLILSWNFKHIVNLDRIRKFNAVNLLRGYLPIEIRSPLEVEHGDQDEDV